MSPLSSFALRRLTVALLGGVMLLAGCTFSYLPPIPEGQAMPTRLELRSADGLIQADGRLALEVTLVNLSREGWLAVQWFSPQNREVASEAQWVSATPPHRHRFVLPEEVALTPGRWRAVVSFEGELLRQFSLEVE
jgi:hypothetical protein